VAVLDQFVGFGQWVGAVSGSLTAAAGTLRAMLLPNMPTFEPDGLVTNSSSAIGSSGLCIGIIAAGGNRSPRPLK
jgi:hypothetical protein